MVNSENEKRASLRGSIRDPKLAGCPFGLQVSLFKKGLCALPEDTEVPLHVLLCP